MSKKIWKLVFGVLLVLILASPVAALVAVSRLEQAQYAPAETIVVSELAYGDVCMVMRQDMEQTVQADSGMVVSMTHKFMELNDFRDPMYLRFIVETGDRIEVGDVIGYYKGEPVLATQSGVIERISLGGDCYMMLASLDDLAIECYVDAAKFDFSAENLQLSLNGDVFRVARIEDAPQTEPGTKLILRSDTAKLTYGKRYDTLTFHTGTVFSNVLVVDARCVYKRAGKTYVKTTTPLGVLQDEVEVKTGYSDGKYICISPAGGGMIEEKMYCDAGYRAVVEGWNRYAQ